MKTISAVLLMGGSGSRFGSSLPKQFFTLNEKKIYIHALERLIQNISLDELVIVCPKDFVLEVQKELKKDYPEAHVIEGGNTRQESAYRGILACKKKGILLIHDAVRPFITKQILSQNIELCKLHKAVCTCIPMSDSVCYAPKGTEIESSLDRSFYWNIQTPQTFSHELILQAHEKAKKEKLSTTDDSSLVLRLPHPVKIALGRKENIKITTPLDLLIAESILKMENET